MATECWKDCPSKNENKTQQCFSINKLITCFNNGMS